MNLPNEAGSSPPGEAALGESRLPRKLGDLQKTITMAQIAKAANVSQGAISSLLNDRDYGIRVSEKTRERVFKVCREMGYIPNDLRAVVRMYPELGDTCLLVPSSLSAGLTDPFVARLVQAAIQAMPDSSRAVTVAVYDDKRDFLSEPDALPQPVRAGICSKYLCLGSASHGIIQALHRRGAPVVSLGHDAALPGVLSIVPDYAHASRLAIEHLHALGHRQIGIVSGPFGATDAPLLELNRGVRLACEELGLPIDARMIVYGDLGTSAGRAAFDEFFGKESQPTAIFCLRDAAAAGVLAAAASRGVRVPEQLSVVGCSDDGCGELAHPPLTTVHLPAEEMGSAAIREIDHLVREPLSPEPRKIVLPVALKVRSSTAAPPQG